MCELPMEAGACDNRSLSWFFNIESGECQAFTFNGCSGNANRFETKEQCDRLCGEFRGVGKCSPLLKIRYVSKMSRLWL